MSETKQTEPKVTPYVTAKRMVDQGVFTQQQLDDGIKNGSIAPPKRNRDFGADQEAFEAIQKYVDEINASTEEFTFGVMGRKKD